jgi:formylglycine-generating enzyme required for sulfatase activity
MRKINKWWWGISGCLWLTMAGAGATKPHAPSAVSEPEMVLIPEGSFSMGCQKSRDDQCDDDENPAHKVRISPFLIGKYEVTQGQWKAMMGKNPSSFNTCGDTCPVENISWDEVQIYIQKLNTLTGKVYRLPTEAEWEYACRANSEYKYCGSDQVDEVSWHWESDADKSHSVDGREFIYDPDEPIVHDNRPHPVGMKKPNGFGLYDMSGNVYEWIQDVWHENYKGAPSNGNKAWEVEVNSKEMEVNLKDPPEKRLAAENKRKEVETQLKWRVLRGGPWNLNSKSSRATIRTKGWTVNQSDAVGFRLVRTP